MDTVSKRRLREDIEATAEFGDVATDKGCGRTVLTGTEANRQAREYLLGRLGDAGLDVHVDAVGNIVGLWTPNSADPNARPIASGSHLDSVPKGGIFDGPLGVYGALEAVRAMQDRGFQPKRPVEVVSFTEEEGQRFASGVLGSSVAAGVRSVEEALSLTDDEGVALASVLEEIGFLGEGQIAAGDWDAWLELHIEQSTRLTEAGATVGVVTDITGITHCKVEITGQANHAGSTPMDIRSDALAAASEFVLAVEQEARRVAEEHDTAVGTVGNLNVSPNATNVVPGHVEMELDIRDVDYELMDHLVAHASDELDRLENERGVRTTIDRSFDVAPMPMSERVRETATAAAKAEGIETIDCHSGAFHDTTHVGRKTDAGLLFAPSEDGVSHTPQEWTGWEDCANATRVLATALARLATRPS